MLEPHAQFVELAQGHVLFEPEEDVVTTHFPLTGTMAALFVVLEVVGRRKPPPLGGKVPSAGSSARATSPHSLGR
jgi:hypothetical protein